jgi:MATE family multidrug resistance protein
MVAMGFGVVAMIRVGNQKGLRQFRELRRIAFSIIIQTSILGAVFALIFILLNGMLPKLYLDLSDTTNLTDNLEVVSIASKLLIIAAVFQISDALQVVTLAALRGMQDVRIPMFITFIAYWIIGFPISYYLSMHKDYGSSGIWIGLLAGLTASAVMCFVRFNQLSKKLILQAED